MKSKTPAAAPTSSPTVPPVHIADLVLEEVAHREAGQLLFIGQPRQYRADCQAGQFKIGASRMMGSTLTLELVAARIVEGALFGYPSQKWVNVLFVDPEGVVSSILFKTESMDNLLEIHRQAIANGDSLLGKTIQGRMSKRASQESGKSYYAVEFELLGEGTYGHAIARFRQETAIEGIYRTLLSKPEPHPDAEAA